MKQTIGEIIKSMFVGSDNNPPTNVIDILKADHRKVEELFKEFDKCGSDEERKNLMDEIVKEISIHAALEEKLVYPELEGEGQKTKEAYEEHHAVKLLVAELADMTGGEDTAPAKVKVLGELVKHHIQEEELDLLPKLKNAYEDLDALGSLVQQEREFLLQNYKPPSKAAEMSEAASANADASSSTEKEVVFNFAPDATESIINDTPAPELEEVRLEDSSADSLYIEAIAQESLPILPELNDDGSVDGKKASKHRTTSVRKKGAARAKASHKPSSRKADESTAKAPAKKAKAKTTAKKSPKTSSSKATKKTSAAKTTSKSEPAKSKAEKSSNSKASSDKATAAKKAAVKKAPTKKAADKKSASAAKKASSTSASNKNGSKTKTSKPSTKTSGSARKTSKTPAAKAKSGRGLKKAS